MIEAIPTHLQNTTLIPYCTTEYEMSYCLDKAEELILSRKYLTVKVKPTSGGYGRIYVNRYWEHFTEE